MKSGHSPKGAAPTSSEELTDQAGKRYWIDNRKYPINGPDGTFIGIFGIAPDITRHLENERRVIENEALLHLFIEHAPAALAMFGDREMRYLAAKPPLARHVRAD